MSVLKPQTEALLKRHMAESDAIPLEVGMEKMREHSVKQVMELIAHARKLEAERDALKSQVAELAQALEDLINPAIGGYSDGFPDEGEVDRARALLAA